LPSQDSAVVGRAIARLGCPVLTAKCHYRKAREKAWFASKASVRHLFMDSKPSMMGFVTVRMSKSRVKGEWQPRPFYPHSHLNLRHNPFGEASPEERVSLAVSDGGELIELFLRPNSAIQVMGDHGRGKTSKLLALKRALLSEEGLDVEYLRLRDRFVIPKVEHLLLDEGEFLFRRPFWRLLGVQHLVISTHRDWSWPLARLGFSVTTILLGQVNEATLKAIFEKRIEWSRSGPGPVPSICNASLKALIRQYGDDVRAMEDQLYERIESMKEVGHVEV